MNGRFISRNAVFKAKKRSDNFSSAAGMDFHSRKHISTMNFSRWIVTCTESTCIFHGICFDRETLLITKRNGDDTR